MCARQTAAWDRGVYTLFNIYRCEHWHQDFPYTGPQIDSHNPADPASGVYLVGAKGRGAVGNAVKRRARGSFRTRGQS